MLVTGTLVYGRGDEQGEKEELAEALAAGSAVEEVPPAALGTSYTGAAPVLIPSADGGAAAEPIPVRASFKSTMTMVTGSYSRSFSQKGSYRGGSFVGAGPRPHFPDATQ